MSVQATPFGTIAFPAKISKKRRAAILRALAWCEQLAKESGMWDAQQSTDGERLVRIVNGHEQKEKPRGLSPFVFKQFVRYQSCKSLRQHSGRSVAFVRPSQSGKERQLRLVLQWRCPQ